MNFEVFGSEVFLIAHIPELPNSVIGSLEWYL
jgi:hypothetical protein